MPIVNSLKGVEEAARVKNGLLLRITEAQKEVSEAAFQVQEVDWSVVEAEAENARQHSLKEYKNMIDSTLEIPLEKLLFHSIGCDLFDELCLRLDVNQRYEDILPQWKNLAVRLEVSELRTKWIETCVRPSEGLTRYLLEVYMRDGGTLGEVLQGLLELGCLDILEMLKEKVGSFLEHRNVPDTKAIKGKIDPKFFSILATLANALGKADPIADMMQRHSLGLKKCSAQSDSGEIFDQRETSVMVRGVGTGAENCDPNPGRDWPAYSPELHLKKRSAGIEMARRGNCCRILLLFADDGVSFSEEAHNMMQGVEHRGVVAEVFRLNESSLWYEMLVSPEACCMKWAGEADYVVPILSPNVVREFHGAAAAEGGGGEDGGLVPTSPMINRFMYTLLRSRYVDAGCRNEVVRPVLPTQYMALLGASPVIKKDPLLRLVWVPLREEKVKARLRGMLAETAKKRSLS